MKQRTVIVNDRMERYRRYYLGRRGFDDECQVKHWKATTRHIAQIRHGCVKGDLLCRRRQRQNGQTTLIKVSVKMGKPKPTVSLLVRAQA